MFYIKPMEVHSIYRRNIHILTVNEARITYNQVKITITNTRVIVFYLLFFFNWLPLLLPLVPLLSSSNITLIHKQCVVSITFSLHNVYMIYPVQNHRHHHHHQTGDISAAASPLPSSC